MEKYVVKIVEENKKHFTKEELELIYKNIRLTIKIFRLGVIEKFNSSEGSF